MFLACLVHYAPRVYDDKTKQMELGELVAIGTSCAYFGVPGM